MPQPLAGERVGADKLIAQHAIDDVPEDRARTTPGRECDTLGAGGGADPQHGALTVGRRTTESSAPGKRRLNAGNRDREGLEMRDLHVLSHSVGEHTSYVCCMSNNV